MYISKQAGSCEVQRCRCGTMAWLHKNRNRSVSFSKFNIRLTHTRWAQWNIWPNSHPLIVPPLGSPIFFTCDSCGSKHTDRRWRVSVRAGHYGIYSFFVKQGETHRGIGVVVLAGKWEEVRQVCIEQRINGRRRGRKCTKACPHFSKRRLPSLYPLTWIIKPLDSVNILCWQSVH